MARSPNRDKSLQPSDDRFRLLVDSVKDYAIFMLDPDGRVLTWNAGAELIKGYSASEIIGEHFSRFYPPEARDFPAYELKVAAAEGRFEDEGWRVRKDGSRFWANVVITALYGSDKALVGFAKVTRDLTDRRESEEQLRHSEERFRLLVEGVNDYAIFMLDVNGNVATWNSGAARIKGYRAEEIVGQHFRKFYPEDAVESGWPEHELKVAAAEGRFVDEGWRVRKDGSRFWAHVTITALRDDTGRLRGFAKLTRDLTERKRTEALEASGAERETMLEAERNARLLAQRTARIKDEFLATLSHELRTPLNAILGWTQLLRSRGAVEPVDFSRAMEIIERNARAQVRLIDDLLDLSRIMSGRFRLDVQQVSLLEIVRGALDSIEPTAQTKGVRLESVLDPKSVIVSGDPARLQQVFWNLLSNAVKFTPKGGRIQVLLQRVNSHIEFSVSDTGIGIPAAFLPHVFERFSQKDSSTHREYGGLGLGLAICKQLVDLHGGSIQAKSMGEGHGATFVVTLPLIILGKERESNPRVHPTAVDLSEAVPLPSLDGVRVLVVDDEADALELIRRVLQTQGALVTTARSGEEALRLLGSHTPDALISDIGMPGMDGYQFMRRMRAAEPKERRMPALALTAFARPEDRKNAILAGYHAHLAKPFDMAELAIVVAGLVGRT
ncbi:MAG TPA: PAS domain S-box protein [Burkholderiales bacterium]|jgi:PAS domain S-box-containing protein|nr:PAS domain S-box protein [Burkholderiales bacterium]